MSVVSDLLRETQALLGKGRSEHYEAMDDKDEPVDPTHESAAKFSIWGALTRAAYDRRDSTGMDSALVYLGVDNIQDPQLRGLNRLDDEAINKRFEEAIRLADGGARQERSLDAERKMRSPEELAEMSKPLRPSRTAQEQSDAIGLTNPPQLEQRQEEADKANEQGGA